MLELIDNCSWNTEQTDPQLFGGVWCQVALCVSLVKVTSLPNKGKKPSYALPLQNHHVVSVGV